MALKILLADDSMIAQSMGKKILTEAGYDVVVVSNGAVAVKKIPEVLPDLVLLDVYMPGYNGLEVCERVKKSPETAHIPVLLTVGKLEPFRPEDGMRVKADGIIIKPFEATDLTTVVGKLAERVQTPVLDKVVLPPVVSPVVSPEPASENSYMEAEAEELAVAPVSVPHEMAGAPAFSEDMLGAPEPDFKVVPPPTAAVPYAMEDFEVAPVATLDSAVDASPVEVPTEVVPSATVAEIELPVAVSEPEPEIPSTVAIAPFEIRLEPIPLEPEVTEMEFAVPVQAEEAKVEAAPEVEATVSADVTESSALAPEPVQIESVPEAVSADAMPPVVHIEGEFPAAFETLDPSLLEPSGAQVEVAAPEFGISLDSELAAAEEALDAAAYLEPNEPASETEPSAPAISDELKQLMEMAAGMELAEPSPELGEPFDGLSAVQPQQADELPQAAIPADESEAPVIPVAADALTPQAIAVGEQAAEAAPAATACLCRDSSVTAEQIADRLLERMRPQLVEEIKAALQRG